MKRISPAVVPILLTVLGILTTCTIYLAHEINSTEQKSLSENDVITIIDQRLEVLEKRRSAAILDNLRSKYQLAAESTVDDRLIYGKADARITLKEFADIECPYCRKMHGQIKQVVDQSKGVINWKFRHFPLESHNPAAVIESQAVECVLEAYDNRTAWVALDQIIIGTQGGGQGIQDIPEHLRSIGLNGSLINQCLESNSNFSKIAQDYKEGRMTGVTATPALLIIDNKTGRRILLKGYQRPEQILPIVQKLIDPK